ncbi:proteasome assembly chaperone (PAC2) family protein [Allocatelliglobosispora scoriae]|uniref:Proteasome assembly chaperone (PAC2) family protein n=1 Tax=Allocatelliglobosispora scoriae TaxID=643052 RepID=A0A841C104_9ACTN|nr:PAC2 family protein [Allocatelliglobosispora scoriae]MBB5872833.1 proteasome assembly chaperone (PAC2) family protein [Allocatelliglobosispora scoriae]
MRDPRELYQLDGQLPELGRPVLLHALHGFVDAGNAGRLAREHLVDVLEGQVLAEFDIDELFDYRARRPLMRFNADHWEHYDAPKLTLHSLRDDDGTPFLLLAGAEPDLQWERFVAAMTGLIEDLGVRTTIGIHAIPMAVPHTRPAGVTAHATRPELIAGHEPWFQRVQVPASMTNLLEFRLGQVGHDAIGFAAHVPNYLAEADYQPAAEALLGSVSRSTGLLLPTDGLRVAGEQMRLEVERQLANNEQAESVVRALEEQYDAFTRGRSTSLLSATPELPTADELGAELERFLAEHHRDSE